MTELKEKEILFSFVSGENYYRIKSVENDVIRAKHEKFNCDVEIKIFHAQDYKTGVQLLQLASVFYCPPGDVSMICPIDVVKITNFNVGQTQYKGDFGLVFPKSNVREGFVPIREIVYGSKGLGWDKDSVKKLSLNITKQLQKLDELWYCYPSFDVDKIYYNPKTFDVIFDFSFSLFYHYNSSNHSIYYEHTICANDLSLDFMPPWVDFENYNSIKKVSVAMEYYSLAALLFRLIIGKLPYQGEYCSSECSTLMEYDADEKENITHHNYMMKKYLEKPIFIFDKQNIENTIGKTNEEKVMIQLWERLPQKIQDMFSDVFTSTQEDGEYKLFSPNQWHEVLCDLWNIEQH